MEMIYFHFLLILFRFGDPYPVFRAIRSPRPLPGILYGPFSINGPGMK